MQGDPSMFPDVPDGSTAGYCTVVALAREPSMFSLQYIAPPSFFLSPNAHLPWRTFQCQDTSKGQSSKTTYKCLNREKPLVPGRSHAKTYRLTVRSWLPW